MNPESLAVGIAMRRFGPRQTALLDALVAWSASPAASAIARRLEFLIADYTGLEAAKEHMARHPCLRAVQLHEREYDDGDARNFLLAETNAQWVMILDECAALGDAAWLGQALSDALAGDWTAAVAPAAGVAAPLFEDSHSPKAAGMRADEIEPAAFLLQRSAWQRHPFHRAPLGACALLGRALRESRLKVGRLAALSCERPSDALAERERALARGWLAAAHGVGRVPKSRAEAQRWARQQDAPIHTGNELASTSQNVDPSLRDACAHALFEGTRGVKKEPRSRVLARGTPLSILYVVHGFPPEAWAGTEVYTLELALELKRRGHKVSVLARASASVPVDKGGRPEFSLSCDEFRGLRVWRMVHRIEHASMRESYHQPRAEDRFREVLLQEQPDVVHFQHLLHFSAGLPVMTKQRGIPSVITCNDYWALCARVQMIRPDGVVCQENQGLGCLVCVKHKEPSHIPWARQAFPLVTPLIPMARLLANHPRIPSAKMRRKLARVDQARQTLLSRWGRAFEHIKQRQPFVLAGYSAADMLIAPSRFLRTKYLESGAFDPQRFVYSDYGMRTADVHAMPKQPDPGGRLRLGFIGSVVWYKGLDVLVRAVRKLDSRPVVLKVHGRFDPKADPHHADIEALARGGGIEFLGGFDNARLAEVFAGIDVLVVPSVWFENSPLTIHEAFLHRTPVLTSNIGGMAELVRDGKDGLHFAVGDSEDLARKIATLIDQPSLRAELARDFPRVKSIEENGREMEYRYRSLVCTFGTARRALIGG